MVLLDVSCLWDFTLICRCCSGLFTSTKPVSPVVVGWEPAFGYYLFNYIETLPSLELTSLLAAGLRYGRPEVGRPLPGRPTFIELFTWASAFCFLSLKEGIDFDFEEMIDRFVHTLID